MSTIWTPGGERPVRSGPEAGSPPGPSNPPPPPSTGLDGEPDEPDEAELRQHLEELRQQLAATPAEIVIANHGFGLFELAALHLSLAPPQLAEARLAIDALAALVEGVAGRLGDQEGTLRDGLAQLRLAYVQIQAAIQAATQAGGDPASGNPDQPG